MDTYKTISAASNEVLLKEKNSKFFGYAFPVADEEQVKIHLDALKKQHHGAVHWCYAWQIGTEKTAFRANDDGEPSNTAGMPIYGQIQSFQLTNVLVVVVRFYGGIKLGVGGLISAYRETAKMALEAADIVEETIKVHFVVSFDYKHMNKVMRIIKEKNLDIVSQKMDMACEIHLAARKRDAEMVFETLNAIFEARVERI